MQVYCKQESIFNISIPASHGYRTNLSWYEDVPLIKLLHSDLTKGQDRCIKDFAL